MQWTTEGIGVDRVYVSVGLSLYVCAWACVLVDGLLLAGEHEWLFGAFDENINL